MLKALIFDSFYDKHRGVVAYIRLFNGSVKSGDTIYFLASKSKNICQEVGVFLPNMQPTSELSSGEVGYLVTGMKELDLVRVGDTIADQLDPSLALPGYKQVVPKVFASIFPTNSEEYPKLRESISKLKLNDAALTFEPENIPALGFGFRCGFLGLLHMDIVQERLAREFDIDLVITTPSVEYQIVLRREKSEKDKIKKPSQIPDLEELKKQLTDNLNWEILTK